MGMVWVEEVVEGCDQVDATVSMVQTGLAAEPFYLDINLPATDPFVIEFTPLEVEAQEPMVIEFPPQFPMEKTHQVPWNYQLSTMLVDGKPIAEQEEGVSAVTKFGKVMPDPMIEIGQAGKGKEQAKLQGRQYPIKR